MKIFFVIGWRNLWRNKRRSLVVISSIAIGIFAMLISIGIMNGMNNQMVQNTIKTSLGHISIFRKGFFDDSKLQYSFIPDRHITDAISKNKYVRSFTPRVKLEGMIRSSDASQGVLIMGIDPGREKTVSNIFGYTLRDQNGRFLAGPDSKGIMMSRTMARKLGLLVGDKVVIMFQDINKDMVGNAFRVRGLFETPMDSFDKYVVYVGISTLQRLTGLKNRISEINIIINDKKNVDKASSVLRQEIDDSNLEILTWKQRAPNLVQAVAVFNKMMYISFAIIFITVIFSIANTLIMAIMERFHEIGVMKSIGTPPSRIGALVVFEAINLGLVGLATGFILAIICISMLSSTGINLGFFSESLRTWGTGTIIYPALTATDFVVSNIIVLMTTIIAAIYPALKAARINPLDALHFV